MKSLTEDQLRVLLRSAYNKGQISGWFNQLNDEQSDFMTPEEELDRDNFFTKLINGV